MRALFIGIVYQLCIASHNIRCFACRYSDNLLSKTSYSFCTYEFIYEGTTLEPQAQTMNAIIVF